MPLLLEGRHDLGGGVNHLVALGADSPTELGEIFGAEDLGVQFVILDSLQIFITFHTGEVPLAVEILLVGAGRDKTASDVGFAALASLTISHVENHTQSSK